MQIELHHISQAQSVNIFIPADVHKKNYIKFISKLGKKVLKAFIIADLNQFKELKILTMHHQLMLQRMFINLKINNNEEPII